MGKITYALRFLSGLVMVGAVIAGFGSFSDAMDNLGRPEGERTLGVLFLVATAAFLVAFVSAGMLWVLSEISEQLELSKKPVSPPEIMPTPGVARAS